jgi:hypothetical protein
LTWPELYKRGDDDGKVDVFSFALIMQEIIVGRRVFSSELSMPQLALKVAKGERVDIPVAVEPFVIGLIWRGSSDPTERPSFQEIFEELRDYEFCVACEGLIRADIELYVRWIEAESPPSDSADPGNEADGDAQFALPPSPRAAQVTSDLGLDLSSCEHVMTFGAGAISEGRMLRGSDGSELAAKCF